MGGVALFEKSLTEADLTRYIKNQEIPCPIDIIRWN